MRKGGGLVAGGLGAILIVGIATTVMSGAGQEIYRSLTEGPPGVRPPDPPADAGSLLAPDAPLGRYLDGDSALAEHIRTGDGPVARQLRQQIDDARHPKGPPPRPKDMAVQLASVELADPTGRDLRVLLAVLEGGLFEQRAQASAALATLGDPRLAVPILRASVDAPDAHPHCEAALVALSPLSDGDREEALAALLGDRDLTMHGDCRARLKGALDAMGDGAKPTEAGSGAPEPSAP